MHSRTASFYAGSTLILPAKSKLSTAICMQRQWHGAFESHSGYSIVTNNQPKIHHHLNLG